MHARAQVEGSDDLNRDVLKGDTASVEIPALDFSMEGGAEAGEAQETLAREDTPRSSRRNGLKRQCYLLSHSM